ncbi:MAG: acyltransferase [Cytophagia bacterium]|nr:acyltransferase [Cytophagia bacterium]
MSFKKIYFPNLNGLRFIAAFLVIIHHMVQFKSINGIQTSWDKISSIDMIGKLGVVLFFVLSGFLITYLLLIEEKRFKKISIKQFYIRRALRIWPLYFFLLLLAFFVLPNIDVFRVADYGTDVLHTNLVWRLLLCLIFLPGISFYLFGLVPYASHTWSIGSEEQYYLIWPVLLKYFKTHRMLLITSIIIFYVGIRFLLASPYANLIPFHTIVGAYWQSFPISCMAIGGLYSILYFQKNPVLKYLVRNDIFYISTTLACILMIIGVYIPFFQYEFYSALFGLIILNFSVNDKIRITLENRVLNYLGKISYGLYMYHPIAISLAISIGLMLGLNTNWFFYPVSMSITIVMAGLSYEYFESFFLKYKTRYSKVLSGNTIDKG